MPPRPLVKAPQKKQTGIRTIAYPGRFAKRRKLSADEATASHRFNHHTG